MLTLNLWLISKEQNCHHQLRASGCSLAAALRAMAVEKTCVPSLRRHLTLVKEKQSVRVFRKSANPSPQCQFTQKICPTLGEQQWHLPL